MIDLVFLYLKAGDGGHGRVSFRREKYVPRGGPDGGDGGRGGNIILRATSHKSTLAHLAGAKNIEAQPGQMGGKRKKTGSAGEDMVIEVPVGTVVWQLDVEGAGAASSTSVGHKFDEPMRYQVEKEGQSVPPRPYSQNAEVANLSFGEFRKAKFEQLEKRQLLTLAENGQEVVICQGGLPGRGNTAFKGPANTTPLEAEYGEEGEGRVVALELQLLANIGLVGLPNSGKSTLLSKLTKATPKIANYPFTTLEPHLGLLQAAGHELVIADIPGLIEGASEGKGLGYQFLRHIKGCQVLWYVLYLEETEIFAEGSAVVDQAEQVWQQYQTLLKEVHAYEGSLVARKSVVTLNKIDIYPEELLMAIQERFAREKVDLLPFSAATNEGLTEVTNKVVELFSDAEREG